MDEKPALTLNVQPRAWQCEALKAWEIAKRRGVVQVVTGGGKTIFAELCMQAISASVDTLRYVIIVPTQALLDQWYVSLIDDLKLAASDIGLYSGRSKPRQPRLVNLMVINTARQAAPRIAGQAPTMLVVDECHRAGSLSNAAALEGAHLATLGLSATPEREYDTGFEERISPALGPVVYRYDLNDASRDGVVAPYDLVNVAVELLPHEKIEYDRLTARIARLSKRGESDPEIPQRLEILLRRRARVSARALMRAPVAVRLIEQHRGARSLIFHEEIDQAEAIFDRLIERGHSATIYHSRIGPNLRRDNLRLFRHGVFDIIVSCRALDEGVNVPETEVAVIASATASTRQRIQRLGRVLRPASGKQSARVYTLYATDAEEQRLVREAAILTSARSVEWQRVRVERG